MISKKVFQQLTRKGLTIAFAESMTGGLMTYELIKNPGASKVIKGSIVAYSDEEKVNLLGISKDLISKHSVVSKEIAMEMSMRIKEQIESSIGVGITGNAGPSLQKGTNKQEVWIGISTEYHQQAYHLDLSGLSRIQAIRKATRFTYEKLTVLI
jgi:nicotinamide-nucleotide amidase